MALVSCRECAAQISDQAATCPHCGVSGPAGMGSLTFVRSGLKNAGLKVHVYVDGKPFGTMGMRGQVVVPVTPGNHHVELRASDGKATAGSVNATSGNTVLTVTMSAMGTPRIQ